MPLPGIHHRLDSEGHTGFQLESRAWLAVVQDLWIFVVDASYAVAAVLAHDGIIPLFDEGLNSVADVSETRARFDGLDAPPHRFEAGLGEALGMGRRLPDEIHAACVAVKPIADNCDVDVDDIASLEALIVRYPVTHHVIH